MGFSYIIVKLNIKKNRRDGEFSNGFFFSNKRLWEVNTPLKTLSTHVTVINFFKRKKFKYIMISWKREY